MSDLSDSDTNEPNNNNESEDIHVNDTEDHVVERIFDLSNRLQAYCRDRGLPIFNDNQTTAILLEMYHKIK